MRKYNRGRNFSPLRKREKKLTEKLKKERDKKIKIYMARGVFINIFIRGKGKKYKSLPNKRQKVRKKHMQKKYKNIKNIHPKPWSCYAPEGWGLY